VLRGKCYPDLINDNDTLMENSFVVPDEALREVPAALRAPAGHGLAETGPGTSQWERRDVQHAKS